MLSLDTVLKGIEHREKIMLPYYQEEVEIRALSDSEFAEARRKSGIIKVASALEKAKATEKEEGDLSGIDLVEVDASVAALHLVIAEMGLVDPKLSKNASKLMGGSVQIIGEAIIKMTTSARDEVLNFSTAKKGKE